MKEPICYTLESGLFQACFRTEDRWVPYHKYNEWLYKFDEKDYHFKNVGVELVNHMIQQKINIFVEYNSQEKDTVNFLWVPAWMITGRKKDFPFQNCQLFWTVNVSEETPYYSYVSGYCVDDKGDLNKDLFAKIMKWFYFSGAVWTPTIAQTNMVKY